MYGIVTLYDPAFQPNYPRHAAGNAPLDYNSNDVERQNDFQVELLPLHSQLLGESLLVSFPPLINMLKSSGSSYLISGPIVKKVFRERRAPVKEQVPPRHTRHRAALPTILDTTETVFYAWGLLCSVNAGLRPCCRYSTTPGTVRVTPLAAAHAVKREPWKQTGTTRPRTHTKDFRPPDAVKQPGKPILQKAGLFEGCYRH